MLGRLVAGVKEKVLVRIDRIAGLVLEMCLSGGRGGNI